MSSYSLAGEAAHQGPILILTRSLNIGGAQRQIVQLALGLHERGQQVVVALFYGGGSLERELVSHGVPICRLGKRHRWHFFGFMVRLIKALWRVRPRVVYAFLGTSNVVAALAEPFAPPFRLLWSVRASNMNFDKYSWASKLGYGIECALSWRPDLIISNSEAGVNCAALNGFPRERMIVVPNGIDVGRFRRDDQLRAAWRARLGLPVGLPAVGVLARLDPMKDHKTFLSAAATIAKIRPDVRFLCIGEGDESYTEELFRFGTSLGLGKRLIWTGAVSDSVGVLNALDVVCSSSSEGEGFSNAVAEAMACCRPCVVTDVGDSAFLVADTGWVVPPQNPDALADALLEALKVSSLNIGNRARKRIVENFSVEKMVEGTLACF